MEKKPFVVRIDGEDISLTPDNTGVGLFRNRPEMDYVDYHVPLGDEDDSEAHTWMFNREFALWIGNVAIRPSDVKILQLANRTNGTFKKQTGWNPEVIVSDEPTEWEYEIYTRHLLGHDLDSDEELHKALSQALREDLLGEGDHHGA